MRIKDHIPNTITLLNLLSGCFAIVAAFKYELAMASILIFVGAFFDYVDGTVARLLNARSDLGKQLDSLADVVTFGVVPGIIVYQLINKELHIANYPFLHDNIAMISGIPFLLTLFSAVRLAKFNIDDRQTISFLGLPTPANAIFWAAIPLIYKSIEPGFVPQGIIENIEYTIYSCFGNPYLLLALSIVMSLFLVIEVPLFSLKFKNFKWEDNKTRYLFLITALLLLLFLNVFALPLIIFLYVIFSIVNNIFL